MRLTEFQKRQAEEQRQERHNWAHGGLLYELTTLLERGGRVLSAERFERSYPEAAVMGLAMSTPAGREAERRLQEQRRAADREWRREKRRIERARGDGAPAERQSARTPRPAERSPRQKPQRSGGRSR